MIIISIKIKTDDTVEDGTLEVMYKLGDNKVLHITEDGNELGDEVGVPVIDLYARTNGYINFEWNTKITADYDDNGILTHVKAETVASVGDEKNTKNHRVFYRNSLDDMKPVK